MKVEVQVHDKSGTTVLGQTEEIWVLAEHGSSLRVDEQPFHVQGLKFEVVQNPRDEEGWWHKLTFSAEILPLFVVEYKPDIGVVFWSGDKLLRRYMNAKKLWLASTLPEWEYTTTLEAKVSFVAVQS